MTIEVSKNYTAYELAHPAWIEEWGVVKVAQCLKRYWPYFVKGQQRLREFIGAPVTVNNYHWDKDYKKFGWDGIKDRDDLRINSGLRHIQYPLNDYLSGHYFGATDSIQDKYDPIDLENKILNNQERLPFIVELESHIHTPTWTHALHGRRQTGQSIKVFNP